MTSPTPRTSGSGTGVGPMWRKLCEKQRQTLSAWFPSLIDGSFHTPRTRQAFMEEEARQFAANIRLMEKDIRGLKLADEQFMTTCQQVLSTELPRVYDFGEDGHVHAVGSLDTIGRGCDVDNLVKVQQELSQGLEQDVLTPMKQWLFAWSTVQARLKELEEMRIEVDSRKRQVFNLRNQEAKHKDAVDKAKNDHQRKTKEKGLEDIWRKQQRKDAKLANATAAYQSMESEVLEELAGLIRDAVCLKSYLAACTEFQREAYQSLTHTLLGGATAAGAVNGSAGGSADLTERTRTELRQASTSQPTGQSQLSSSVEIGEDNPFTPQNTKKNTEKNVSVNLNVTPGDSPVKATLKANTQAVMNTSGHSLYGDDIKLPSPDSPLR